MLLQYDPEYYKALEPLLPALSKRAELKKEAIQGSRDGREKGVAAFFDRLPDSPDVTQTTYHIELADGHQLSIIGFVHQTRHGSGPGPAILHYHGGGMIMGSAEMYRKRTAIFTQNTGIPLFSVNYRLAPEHSGLTPVEDSYAALVWLHETAQQHNIDPARIALYGESAGGGLAVGVALLARDRGIQPPLAKQILVYPMLDDRNVVVNEELEPLAFWKTKDNVVAWNCLLGDDAGNADADISPYVAPARAKSVVGLPPAYIDVGELDIFRDEGLKYATRLLAENIQTEFHLYPGVPHAFEMIAPEIWATKKAFENRTKAMLGV